MAQNNSTNLVAAAVTTAVFMAKFNGYWRRRDKSLE